MSIAAWPCWLLWASLQSCWAPLSPACACSIQGKLRHTSFPDLQLLQHTGTWQEVPAHTRLSIQPACPKARSDNANPLTLKAVRLGCTRRVGACRWLHPMHFAGSACSTIAGSQGPRFLAVSARRAAPFANQIGPATRGPKPDAGLGLLLCRCTFTFLAAAHLTSPVERQEVMAIPAAALAGLGILLLLVAVLGYVALKAMSQGEKEAAAYQPAQQRQRAQAGCCMTYGTAKIAA